MADVNILTPNADGSYPCQAWHKCSNTATKFIEIPDDNGEPMNMPMCDHHYARYHWQLAVIQAWKHPTGMIQ